MPSWFPDNLSETVFLVPLRIAFLILLALIARYVLHRVITRGVRRMIGRQMQVKMKVAQALVDATTLPAARREQRILALGSLARSIVTFVILMVTTIMILAELGFVILMVTTIMILAELGFNIATILAGTSIVALTVAFGVQSIVKDLSSGVFMLIEDQLGIGDYVDMDQASGTVEAVGLRITQLRDDDGNVWYVRNGEVLRIGNFSQGGTGRPAPGEAQPAS
jgi:moderate conductance mechanosensitive channel